MKTQKNIMIAFVLNLAFSVIEYVGGILTGSVAILSDSVHDFGDALSIGISYLLEKKSGQQPDDTYTYGYKRFSVLGGVVTITILIVGSILVIVSAVRRIISPVDIHYNGMILLALAGCILNLLAAWFTREGDSINQKAVNLHMLEDVLGWVVVLLGAVIMRFTDISIIDPIMSLAVSLFILVSALKELKRILYLFLEKTPEGITVKEVQEQLTGIDGVLGVHHIHIWSMDGYNKYATMHVVTDEDPRHIKHLVREALHELDIRHVTIELEKSDEDCCDTSCRIVDASPEEGHHHHHHHH